MSATTIRKQGGAAIMTIPSDVLKSLGVDIGAELDVRVSDGALVARPKPRPERRRLSLRDLLQGATPDAMRELVEETASFREGEPVGREIG